MPDTCDSRRILFDGSLKSMSIFASPVAFRACCWFPFSPCSLNMPWPGFPHVVRMIHRYGLHWSFFCYLLLHFFALCLPLSLPFPSKTKPHQYCLTSLHGVCEPFFFFFNISFCSKSCMLHLAMSRMPNSMYSCLFPPFFSSFLLKEIYPGDMINLLEVVFVYAW